MPKTSRQTRGEVIRSLQGKKLITLIDLEIALSDAGIDSDAAAREYVRKLVDLNYLERVADGYKLSPESQKTTTITLKVTPSQNSGDVIQALRAMLPRFGKVVTMLIEVEE